MQLIDTHVAGNRPLGRQGCPRQDDLLAIAQFKIGDLESPRCIANDPYRLGIGPGPVTPLQVEGAQRHVLTGLKFGLAGNLGALKWPLCDADIKMAAFGAVGTVDLERAGFQGWTFNIDDLGFDFGLGLGGEILCVKCRVDRLATPGIVAPGRKL